MNSPPRPHSRWQAPRPTTAWEPLECNGVTQKRGLELVDLRVLVNRDDFVGLGDDEGLKLPDQKLKEAYDAHEINVLKVATPLPLNAYDLLNAPLNSTGRKFMLGKLPGK